MKKSTRKLQLSRETLTTLTLAPNQLAAGGEGESSIILQPQLPPTSDTVRICCA
jgi:hypothetical protein